MTPQPSDDIRPSKVKLLTKKFDQRSKGSSSVKNAELRRQHPTEVNMTAIILNDNLDNTEEVKFSEKSFVEPRVEN